MLKFLREYLAAGQIAIAATLANIIGLCITPFVTRIYSPSDFGAYSTFIALTFVDVVACLGYDKAIVAARDGRTAQRLLSLSILCALGFSTAVAVAALAVPAILHRTSASSTLVALMLPVCVLMVGILNAINAIAVRELQFHAIALARIAQALGTSAIQLCTAPLVLVGLRPGLILGQALGTAAAIATMILWRRRARANIQLCLSGLRSLAQQHSTYVFNVVPGLLSNSAALQMPILAVELIYGATTTGLFGLTQRIAGAPMALLGLAVGQVFAGKLSHLLRSGASKRDATRFYLHSAMMMSPIALGIAAIAPFAPRLFALLLGASWEPAGHIFRSMSPLYCLQAMVAPLQFVFFLVGRNDLYWKTEASRLITVLLAFGCATGFKLTPDGAFRLLGSLGATAYVVSAIMAIYALRHARFPMSDGPHI